jgi:DNA-3-methyladenine glycosylase II
MYGPSRSRTTARGLGANSVGEKGSPVPEMIMMLDHPAWVLAEDGRARRAFRSAGAVWSVVCTPRAARIGHVVDVARVSGDTDVPPAFDVVNPHQLAGPDSICEPLRVDGPVGRVRNPDLWEALATSVIRQVIRAGQARKLYRKFCDVYGERVETAAGPASLFPTPETVLNLSDDEFATLGMKFFRRALRAVAEAYLKTGHNWAGLPATQLLVEIQTVPRIGPWTAGATVADVTNDYSLYPYADLAVRTWAQRLAPSVPWPETEREFGRTWQAMAGERLSDLTLLTLAWGVRHANGVAI